MRSSLNRAPSDRSMNVTLVGSAILLWLPYTFAALYECYCKSFVIEDEFGTYVSSADRLVKVFSNTPVSSAIGRALNVDTSFVHLGHSYHHMYYYFFPEGFDVAIFLPLVSRVLLFSAIAMFATYVLVHVKKGGELLMMVSWLLGVCSTFGWLTDSELSLPSPFLPEQRLHVNTTANATTSPFSGKYTRLDGVMNASSSPLMNTSRRVVPPFLLAEVVPRPPPGMWLMVSLVTGFFSGILCKVKDIMEGKHRPTNNNVVVSSPTFPSEKSSNRGNTVTSILQRRNRYNLIGIGERMYMVVPFCTGQWFAFILRNGWRGIVIANGTIVLSLGMVGYTMISYQLIRGQIMKLAPKRNTRRTVRKLVKINKEKGEEKKEDTEETKRDEEDEEDDDEEEEEYEEVVTTIVEESPQIDLIDLFSKLCTTSFGVVFASIIAVNVFVTSLAIPFFRALFHLNALTSGVGIVVELIMYEVA